MLKSCLLLPHTSLLLLLPHSSQVVVGMVLIIDHSADHAQHHTHQTLALSCDKGAKESLTNFPGCGKRLFLSLSFSGCGGHGAVRDQPADDVHGLPPPP